jgi:hypothetical protein
MSNLNIRGFPSSLLMRLRQEALSRGVTLREYVIGKLSGAEGQRRKKIDSALDDRELQEIPQKPGGPEQNETLHKPPKEEAKAPARSCRHGTKLGFHCWKCGGKAKAEKSDGRPTVRES